MKPNFTYNATLLYVHDADTIRVRVGLWMDLSLEVMIRLAHIDAPEIRGDPEVVKKGKASTIALATRLAGTEVSTFEDAKTITGQDLVIKVLKVEKYGRTLAEVFLPGETTSVNQWLIDTGYAKAYEGGTRSLMPEDPFFSEDIGDEDFWAY